MTRTGSVSKPRRCPGLFVVSVAPMIAARHGAGRRFGGWELMRWFVRLSRVCLGMSGEDGGAARRHFGPVWRLGTRAWLGRGGGGLRVRYGRPGMLAARVVVAGAGAGRRVRSGAGVAGLARAGGGCGDVAFIDRPVGFGAKRETVTHAPWLVIDGGRKRLRCAFIFIRLLSAG